MPTRDYQLYMTCTVSINLRVSSNLSPNRSKSIHEICITLSLKLITVVFYRWESTGLSFCFLQWGMVLAGGLRPAIFLVFLGHFGCDSGVYLGDYMVETCCKYIFGPSSLNYIMQHKIFNALDHEMKTSKTRWVKMVGISCTVSLRAWHLALCSFWMEASTMYVGMAPCCYGLWP